MANDYTSRLKKRKPDPGDFGWDNEWHENEDIEDVLAGALLSENRVSSGCAVTDGGGLNADYADGHVYIGGTIRKITGASKLLAGGLVSDDTGKSNWIYVDSAGVVQASTTAPSGEYVPLAMVDCDDTSVLRIGDFRPMTPGQYRMVENDCINGTFEHWQRATSQTTSGYGSDDRFDNLHVGSTKTHSQQSFTPGQTDVPGNPQYYSRTVVTSSAGAANYVKKAHKVLDVRKYSGKRVCIKFHAKADAAKNIAIEGEQNFGSGGSTTVNAISAQKIPLATSWGKNVVFIDFPSITGKTVGTLSFSQINFWFDAGSDFNTNTDNLGQQSGTFEISEIEIYVSDKELPVRRRTAVEELKLCLPYFWRPGLVSAIGAGHAAGAYLSIAVCFPDVMIRQPAVTLIGTYAYVNANTGSIDTVSAHGIRLLARTTVATTAASVTLDGTTNYLLLNAEL